MENQGLGSYDGPTLPDVDEEYACRVELRGRPVEVWNLGEWFDIGHLAVGFFFPDGREFSFEGGRAAYTCRDERGRLQFTPLAAQIYAGHPDADYPYRFEVTRLADCETYFACLNRVRVEILDACQQYHAYPGPNSNSVARTLLENCLDDSVALPDPAADLRGDLTYPGWDYGPVV